MDTYQRNALYELGLSLRASGDIVATVANWPESARAAKEVHIYGACANARQTRVAIEQLMIVCA